MLPEFLVRMGDYFNALMKELYELAYRFEYPYLVDHSKYVNRFGNHATDPIAIIRQTLFWYTSQYK